MKNNSAENTEKTVGEFEIGFLESIAAYALMGWLTATFPLILMLALDFYINKYIHENLNVSISNYEIVIAALCSALGLYWGGIGGLLMTLLRRKNRILPIALAPFLGVIWAIIVGGIGGFFMMPVFLIGGVFVGWIIGVPIGFIAFALFGIVYESFALRRRVRWWQTALIAVGVLILLLAGIFAWVKLNNPYF